MKKVERKNYLGVLTRKLPLEHETTLFVLVNVLDFFMTYLMLTHQFEDGRRYFIESNPVAAFFLYRWGPLKGMLAFKLTIVTVVCIVAQLIATRRLKMARWLLNLGTAVAAVVVLYSLAVFVREAI